MNFSYCPGGCGKALGCDSSGRSVWCSECYAKMAASKTSNSTGLKHDVAKDRWDLLPTRAVRAVVRVLEHGAAKYGDENWKGVEHAKARYYAACLRHLTAWWEGEQLDPESGMHHLAHAVCCLLFLLEGGR